MKITLHDPPKGFEAEAEYRIPKKGESYLEISEDCIRVSEGNDLRRVVLTPKKKKYWRLDPVATFEKATPRIDRAYAYGVRKFDGLLSFWGHGNADLIQWVKLSEHEE